MRRRKSLIFWRIEKRMKQQEVAEKLEITTVHYSNIERGISNPSYEVLVKFRKIFKVRDVIDLFEREENQNDYINTSRNL